MVAVVTRHTAPPSRRAKSRTNRAERYAVLMGRAQSATRRLALACQFAQSFGATLPDARKDALARHITELVEEEGRADGHGE